MIFFALLAVVAGGTLALILGVLGLAEAPWPVLVGILVVALVGLQRLNGARAIAAAAPPTLPPTGNVPPWNRSPSPPSPVTAALTNPVTPAASITPNLVYRGVPYAPKTAIPPNSAQSITLAGTYRGRHWQKSVPAWPVAPSPSPGKEAAPSAPSRSPASQPRLGQP